MDIETFFQWENITLNILLMMASGVMGYYISVLFSHYQNPLWGNSKKYKKGVALKKQEFKLDNKLQFSEVPHTPFTLLLENILVKQFPNKIFLRAKASHDLSNPELSDEKKQDLKSLKATLVAQGDFINGIGYMNFTLKGLDHAKDVAKGHLMLSLNRNNGVGVYLTEDVNLRGTMEIGVIEIKV